MSKTSASTQTTTINGAIKEVVKLRILRLIDRKGAFAGTMTDLSHSLTKGIRLATPANWPSTPSVLRLVVNEVVGSLRKEGIRVEFTRATDHMRTRRVVIESV